MPTPRQRATDTRRRVAMVVAVVAVGIAATALAVNFWPSREPAAPSVGRPAPPDPRDVYEGPYLNVRKDVRYVDDAKCAGCHAEQAESYRHHPMGRSLTLLPEAHDEGAPSLEQYDADHGNPFQWKGYSYSIERDGDHVVHVETKRDDEGQVVSRVSAEMKYALGSGRHARSYLFEREGRLFYSPISWYTQEQKWDISPASRAKNNRFTHGIVHGCVFCHVDRVEREPDAVSKFRVQGAIGCQRCHGPGALHVRRHEQKEKYEGQDLTIVNPARLPPVLRDAVCEQCHLEGDSFARFPRRGRDYFDFRPGLPLQEIVATFASYQGQAAPRRGHVEQMRVSRCYLASDGQLGCISCHDPHVQPTREQRAEYFAKRCLKCHQDRGCSEPLQQRLRRSPNDDCVQCHMPVRHTEQVAHVATTDHRIPRIASEFHPPADPPLKRLVDSPLIRNLQSHLLEVGDPDAARDLGIALVNLSQLGGDQSPLAINAALPLLQAAVDRDPDDAEAWDALGRAFGSQGDGDRALDAFEHALALQPQQEETLANAAYLTLLGGRVRDSLKYWRRAVEINPVCARYRLGLASALLNNMEYQGAIEAYRQVLEMDPAAVDAQLGYGDAVRPVEGAEAAAEHYRLALKHDPDYRPARQRLAEIYIEQQRWKEALEHLLALLEADPGDVAARERVVRCYEALGEKSKADEHRRLLQPLPSQPLPSQLPPDGR